MAEDSKSLIPPNPSLTVACDIPIPGVPSAAECMFKKLMAHIAEFETNLTPDQEVGATFVSFGDKPIYITGIGFHGNDMILFFGMSDKGEPVKIMQHVSQTNVLLTAKKRFSPDKPAKRIGFVAEDLDAIGPRKTSLDSDS